MPVRAKAPAKAGRVKATGKSVAGGKNTKAAAPAAAAPEPKYQADTFVLFKGYPKDKERGIFADGEKVYVHSTPLVDHPTIKNRKLRAYICVKEADAEAAKELTYEALGADDSTISAEECGSGELKPLPPEVVPYHPKAVGALVEYVAAGNLTERIRDLFAQEEATHFAIGGLLAFVRHEHPEEIAKLGYEDNEDGTAWENYLHAEFDISDRTARDYINIYRKFSELPGFTPEMISGREGIGWSKAAMVANYLPPSYSDSGEEQKTAEALMKLAAETPIRDLRTIVKEQFAPDGKTPAGTSVRTGARAGGRGATVKTFSFKLVDAAATTAEKTLELASKQLGLAADSPALFEAILAQWAEDHIAPAQRQRLQKASGVSRVAPRAPAKAAEPAQATA